MKSLRSALLSLTASGIATCAVLTAASLWGLHSATSSAERALVSKDVIADVLPPPMYLIEMRLVLSQAVEGTMPMDQARANFDRLEKEYRARVDYWTQNPPFGLEAQLLGRQHDAAKAFIASARQVLAAQADGRADDARALTAGAHAAYLLHRAGVDDTVVAGGRFAEASMAGLDSTRSRLQWALWLSFAGTVALLVGLGAWARRSVWSATGGEPADAAAVANAVARGDLTVKVRVAAGDQASVMAAMARMCESLGGIVAQVRASSDSMATGSAQIADGNRDLSSRTEQQASALEQTAASMEQLSATIRQNSDHALEAHRLARGASQVATQGGSVVAEVVDTMRGINESSRRIADITAVIDGIAFQTNILALNAAVEAARAGEQGRGFAVVASEVRSLAQRSAAAAKEIKQLIGDSVQRVDAGCAQVDRARTTMDEIVSGIQGVAGIIGRISEATAEQSAGVGQVSEAVAQMDQATQRNAALVTQSAAAADGLRRQAELLVGAVAAFSVGSRPALR